MKNFTLCKGEDQCFCIVEACAFPCTDDVPCMFTCLPFCIVYPKLVCCGNPHKGASVTPTGCPEVEASGAPPQSIEMER